MKINKLKQTKFMGLIIAVLGIIILAVIFVPKIFKSDPKFIYEVAVFAHSQGNDSAESLKSDMKVGDVLVIKKQEEGKTLSWSNTERISYLILKMELTEEQAQKLTMSDEKVIPFKEWSEEEKSRAKEEEERAKTENREYRQEEKRETLRPRIYRIRLEDKEFEGFSREQLLNGQPYDEKVFDWGVVEKKDKL